MAGKNSMLDQDFEEGEGFVFPDDPPQHEEVKEVPLNLKPEEVEVVIEDDTPEADRGMPTSDTFVAAPDEDDEAESYSKKVKKRIDRETAKFNNERRAKEERERQLQELADFSKNLIRENTRLKDMVENGEKVLVNEHTGRLQGELDRAKAAYREAHEAGDVEGMIAAQENIAKATHLMQQASQHQVRPISRTEEKEIDRFVQRPQPTPAPEAMEWAARNTWFGRDDAMSAVAIAKHKALISQGVSPDSGEYYRQIDSEMRMRFPDRFPKQERNQARRTDSVVASVSRGAAPNAGGRMKVTLTATQVRLATRLGLKPEQYAAQLAAERNNEGDWTHGRS